MFTTLKRASMPLVVTGLVMTGVLAATAIGLLVDPRLVTGAPVWLKPAKFAISIAIYSFTLAWIFTFLGSWPRTRRIVGWTTALVMFVEMAIIATQAYRGTTSHFNASTPFDTILFSVMGLAIVGQTITTIAVAVALWRERFADQALGWALRLGMAMTIVGAFTGGLMTMPTEAQLADVRAGKGMPITGAHTVGAPDGGAGLIGTGWSTEYGDLRVAHFMGLHALQALPIAAIVLARRRVRDRARIRLIMVGAASYAGLYVILLAQALRGQSVAAPDALTAILLGGWLLASIAAAYAAAGTSSRARTLAV